MHWDPFGAPPATWPGPTPTFLFAPGRIQKRAAEWGAELQRGVAAAKTGFLASTTWRRVVEGRGPAAVEEGRIRGVPSPTPGCTGYPLYGLSAHTAGLRLEPLD